MYRLPSVGLDGGSGTRAHQGKVLDTPPVVLHFCRHAKVAIQLASSMNAIVGPVQIRSYCARTRVRMWAQHTCAFAKPVYHC